MARPGAHIIQSIAQLERNYGREGAEIIMENLQDTIFGGFAPQSQTAEALSKALGSRTILSGYARTGKGGGLPGPPMMERPLMTPDELKSLPKGEFVVMKTGTHPSKPEPPLENRNAPSPYNGSKGQGQKEEKA